MHCRPTIGGGRGRLTAGRLIPACSMLEDIRRRAEELTGYGYADADADADADAGAAQGAHAHVHTHAHTHAHAHVNDFEEAQIVVASTAADDDYLATDDVAAVEVTQATTSPRKTTKRTPRLPSLPHLLALPPRFNSVLPPVTCSVSSSSLQTSLSPSAVQCATAYDVSAVAPPPPPPPPPPGRCTQWRRTRRRSTSWWHTRWSDGGLMVEAVAKQ